MPRKQSSLSCQRQVKVLVGKDKIEFNVPSAILAQHSKRFEQEGTIVLADEEPALFNKFLLWAYGLDEQLLKEKNGRVDLDEFTGFYNMAQSLKSESCCKAAYTQLYKRLIQDKVPKVKVTAKTLNLLRNSPPLLQPVTLWCAQSLDLEDQDRLWEIAKCPDFSFALMSATLQLLRHNSGALDSWAKSVTLESELEFISSSMKEPSF